MDFQLKPVCTNSVPSQSEKHLPIQLLLPHQLFLLTLQFPRLRVKGCKTKLYIYIYMYEHWQNISYPIMRISELGDKTHMPLHDLTWIYMMSKSPPAKSNGSTCFIWFNVFEFLGPFQWCLTDPYRKTRATWSCSRKPRMRVSWSSNLSAVPHGGSFATYHLFLEICKWM